MSEQLHMPPEEDSPRTLSGDYIIAEPDAAWDTAVTVPGEVEAIWAWVSRLGLVAEGGAGWPMPDRLSRRMPERYRAVQTSPEEFRQLQVGDTVKDGPHSVAQVALLEDRGPTKSIVFASQWPDRRGRPGIHYSWQLTVGENPEGGTDILARTRMANLKHTALTQQFGPWLDQKALELIGEGLAERVAEDYTFEATSARDKHGDRLALLVGVAGGLIVHEATKQVASATLRRAAPVIGALASFGLSRRAMRK